MSVVGLVLLVVMVCGLLPSPVETSVKLVPPFDPEQLTSKTSFGSLKYGFIVEPVEVMPKVLEA